MTPQDQKRCGAILEENNLMFDAIIWLPGCWAMTPDLLAELIDDAHEDEVLRKLFSDKILHDFRKCRDKEEFAEFDVRDICAAGYLVRANTPSPDSFGARINEEGKPVHATYTWGMSNYRWFYGLTLEDIITQAVEWKDGLCQAAWDEKQKVEALNKP